MITGPLVGILFELQTISKSHEFISDKLIMLYNVDVQRKEN